MRFHNSPPVAKSKKLSTKLFGLCSDESIISHWMILNRYSLFCVYLTQEEFGRLFHVTRQTVSNWENGKSYPDLQILVSMSNQFDISLDTLLKEDSKMVQSIDKERSIGIIKHEKSIVDFFTGAGTGLVVSCLFSPDSSVRTTVIIIGIIMIGIGWYKKSKSDKKVFQYIKEHD